MCFFPLNLSSTVISPSKLLGLMVNASYPNVLYASLNVFIVPLLLLPLTFFGFFTYQPIALSPSPNSQIFLFLPSTLLPLLHLVGKISITFSPNNPLLLFFFLKIFISISSTRFFPLEVIAHHLTLLQRHLLLLFLSHFSPTTFTDLSPSSNLYLHFPAPLT